MALVVLVKLEDHLSPRLEPILGSYCSRCKYSAVKCFGDSLQYLSL